jgi:hypothetical protein
VHRGVAAYTLRLWLLAACVLAVVACGGGGGGAGGGADEAEKEAAKARNVPDYGELRPGKYRTDTFEPAFSFEVGSKGWVLGGSEERTLLEMRRGVAGPLVAFLSTERVFNPSKVSELDRMPAPEDMVAWLQRHPYLKTESPRPASVGGIEGTRLDAVVASVPATECGGNCLGLFTDSEATYDWVVYEEERLRFVVLGEVGGERVTIAMEAPAADFEGFLPKVQEVLETVEWRDA